MDFTVNVWAVLVATIVYFALGAAWYMVLSKPWMAAVGFTREQLEQGSSPAIFDVTFLLEVIAVFTLAVILGNSTLGGIGGGYHAIALTIAGAILGVWPPA